MLDERLVHRPIDNDPSLDEDWLNRCDTALLGQEGELTFFRMWDARSGKAWIAVRAPVESPAACQRLERDYRVRLEPAWAVIPAAFIRSAEGPLLVYPAGESIADVIAQGRPTLGAFLQIAVHAANALTLAHQADVLHGALQPRHLFLLDDNQVRLGGFRADTADLTASQGTHGVNWSYLAPEQICPHGSSSDRRSDIYALAAILYQMLVGELPLRGRDKLHWRQLHAGVQPRPATEVRPALPETISLILAKALAKEPDARYQSAQALAVDLAHCQRQWAAKQAIEVFQLGRCDPVPATREGLYGRTGEMREIARILKTQGRDSSPQSLFISGATGMGKSSLVNAALRENARGYWASGKCNSLEQAIPYAPWIDILGALTTQLLAKNSADLQAIGERIRQRIKGRGRLLVKLAPDLKLIIGPMADFPEKLSRLALEKELRAIVEFFQVFTAPGQPLVLFLDDLQWADDATLHLLRELIGQPPSNLLLIFASRSDAAGSNTPLAAELSYPRTLRGQRLDLLPLPVSAVVELICARYHVTAEEAQQVAELVHAKAAGNPFFVRQILKAMVEDQLFTFDTLGMRWSWSLDAVAQHRYADNVADLMVHRLARLPAAQREVLRIAGAAAGRFDEDLLRRLLTVAPERLGDHLKALLDAGFLSLSQHELGFSHDRVQDAAYWLTASDERAALHARIARAMQRTWCAELPDALFEIANQVQRADRFAFAAEECEALIVLLQEAATLARDAASYDQAYGYLQAAEALLHANASRQTRQQHAFALACMAAECDMLLSRMAEAEQRIVQCGQRVRSPLDQATACKLRARLKTLRCDYDGAIDDALAGLRLLGIALERGHVPQQVEAEYRKIHALIERQGRHCLEALPKAESEEVIIAIGLLATLSSSFFIEDDIRFLHLAKIIELTLAHGVAPGSTYGLAWFGVMGAERFAAYHDGHAYCLAALKLIERHGFETDLTSALLALDQVSAWTASMEFARRTALDAIDSGRISGDLAMACYARNHLVSDSLVMGHHLHSVAEEIERGLDTVRQCGYRDIEQILQAQKAFVSALSDGAEARREHTESALCDAPEDPLGSRTTLFFKRLFEGMAAFYLGDIQQAVRALDQAGPLAWAAPAHINLADYHLFCGLTLGCPEAPGSLEHKREQLSQLRERFARWAQFNPMTFRNKLLLIEGVIAKLDGDGLSAIRCFDQAQIAATAAGFIHEQALAHEQLAEVCIPSGLISGANLHLRIARDCFHIWGAAGKVRQLETLHPFLRTQPIQETYRSASQASLDLEAGIEAARALSEEVLLEGLIETLMGHLTLHSGADHGALLIVSGAEFQMAAAAAINDGGLQVSMEDCQKFMTQAPLSIINATMRTKKPLLLHDALCECPEAFRQDLHARGARSVLCLPLVIQGVLIGLVYLENRLVPNLFGSQRLAMLEILASQAAVSLQTAKFYTRLAEDNQTRAQMEAELRRSRAELARSSHLQVMNELSASIAHEISQPLLGIASNAAASLRWLKRDAPDLAEAIDGLEDIRADSERAANIVKALRSLAKQAPLQVKPINLDELVQGVIRLTSADALKCAVKVQVRLEAGVSVKGDPVQLQQLVFNLITNALEALGGFRGDGLLRIGTRLTEAGVEISVDDNGPGISAEERERIFEAFYTTKANGLGMGLAICNSVVRAHGGRLRALVSELGGCRILVVLPVG
ncbi:trifunctional serine/threonine-protein kinase/ATP-binding protein/sensor histidine kinase [Pseudomonas sp. BP8]|uniref:trifunctional serine/threonine-protein kinase/ATP-binding protein/sensor histidine kinase n=1 Tax=Pseudomonas sp. BP8 TaxID=2817864 RepID=UPI001AE1F264|nr:trifunctional serine/threonine-protein kinase/ATP-binding protein/sensor histidine kinase [Pseudomonas sp. BP8]MBP2259809.1 putative ATPase/signal transduction histidine kinase [Pseudomonas sp. BP8]HDS1736355.1 AAA family ATPase [Pseudomonas putida]